MVRAFFLPEAESWKWRVDHSYRGAAHLQHTNPPFDYEHVIFAGMTFLKIEKRIRERRPVSPSIVLWLRRGRRTRWP